MIKSTYYLWSLWFSDYLTFPSKSQLTPKTDIQQGPILDPSDEKVFDMDLDGLVKRYIGSINLDRIRGLLVLILVDIIRYLLMSSLFKRGEELT